MRSQVVLHGEAQQVGVVLEIEGFHDPVLVEHHRLAAHSKNLGDLGHGVTFRQQLQYFALPGSQLPIELLSQFVAFGPIARAQFEGHVRLPAQDVRYRDKKFGGGRMFQNESNVSQLERRR